MSIINDTRKQDLLNTVAKLGRDEGQGRNSRPEFGRQVFLAAADGVIGTSDTGALYQHYADNIGRRATIIGKKDTEEKSVKVQVSKLNQLVKAGAMPFFKVKPGNEEAAKGFMDLVHSCIETTAKTIDKAVPVYDRMVAIAREQQDKIAGPMTEDEIMAALNPEAPERGELAKLKSLDKGIGKLAKEYPEHAEFYAKAQGALAPLLSALIAKDEADKAVLAFNKMGVDAQAAMLQRLSPAPDTQTTPEG